MAIVAGDILSARWSHPDYGSGTVEVKSDEGNTVNFGGFESEDNDKMITSAGNIIDKKTNSRSQIVFKAADEATANTFTALTLLKQSPTPAKWTVQHISGDVFYGSMVIVGKLEKDLNEGTFQVTLQGGKLSKL